MVAIDNLPYDATDSFISLTLSIGLLALISMINFLKDTLSSLQIYKHGLFLMISRNCFNQTMLVGKVNYLER